MIKRLLFGGAAAMALMLLGSNAVAQTCFRSNQWAGWTAPDNRTVYMKVGKRIFRLDMASACHGLRTGATLITHRRGSGLICSATDWNLQVHSGGISVPCIVKAMTQLTPDEIAALPKSDRP